MTYSTNKEYWERLLAEGKLFSYIKDGYPEGLWEKLLGMAYPVMVIAVAIISIILYFRLSGKDKHFKTMFVGVFFGSLVGWIWGGWMLHADSNFPGWIFPIWAVTGIEFIIPLEDWIFYPACTLLFYIIFRKLNNNSSPWGRPWMFNLLIGFYILVTLFYLVFTAACGRVAAVLFAIPGILFFIYAKDTIDLRKYFPFQIILILINCIWDWWAVSWMHSIPGLAWASQWIYLSFDSMGNHIQSSIFLDYIKYPWAWIFNNPIEGTPWMGITGGLLNYSIFSAADKYFYGRGKVINGTK